MPPIAGAPSNNALNIKNVDITANEKRNMNLMHMSTHFCCAEFNDGTTVIPSPGVTEVFSLANSNRLRQNRHAAIELFEE